MKRLAWLLIFVFVPVMAAYAVDSGNIAGVWMLDEGSGDVAADSSGNGNDGVIAEADWVDGKFGKGLKFNDAGSVDIASAGVLQLGNQVTLMAYFYAEALDDWHQLIAKDGEYLLRIDPPVEGGNMSTFINLDAAWEPRASAGAPALNTWTHFTAVYNGAESKLSTYVNGAFVGELERLGNPIPTDNPVSIGHWGGGSNFVGVIDEVAIFSVALGADDIMDIATNGLQTALGMTTSVQPSGKLACTWAGIKK